METEINKPQRVLEELSREEQRSLFKEFNGCVERKYKIAFYIGAFFLVPMTVSAVLSGYYLSHILTRGVVSYMLYVFSAVFTLSGVTSMLLTSIHRKKYVAWLKSNKNIVSKASVKKG